MRPNIENSIINSALWSAAADALGWITELVDKKGVMRRTRKAKVTQTVPWKRKIGGIAGVTVELPAGSYSDDTQLRLAVCRSIQGDGVFDVEAFAKVELSTWASYALGAGRGTKVAASNISKRDTSWFSNFYSQGDQIYFNGGGNGAAMRVQPHVWHRARSSSRDYLTDVLKDSVVTHGHMRGVCGAVFHADCLSYALETGEMPGPPQWLVYISRLTEIVDAVKSDYQLGKLWLGAWEKATGADLSFSINEVQEEMNGYVNKIGGFNGSLEESYGNALRDLECFTTRVGTGTTTAIAAAYLAWIGQDAEIENVIQVAVNALGSDTDTIGTMVGALLGSISMSPPKWELQDEEYIRSQALRMARIADGRYCDSFQYPDLMSWQPPSSQSNAVSFEEQGVFLKGFGALQRQGKNWSSGIFTWEWFELPFGQTIICKYKTQAAKAVSYSKDKVYISDSVVVSSEQIDKLSPDVDAKLSPAEVYQLNSSLPLFPMTDTEDYTDTPRSSHFGGVAEPSSQKDFSSIDIEISSGPRSIGVLTDIVIKSNFNSQLLGQCFLECVTGENAIENAIAFSAILGKAIDVREKKAKSKRDMQK